MRILLTQVEESKSVGLEKDVMNWARWRKGVGEIAVRVGYSVNLAAPIYRDKPGSKLHWWWWLLVLVFGVSKLLALLINCSFILIYGYSKWLHKINLYFMVYFTSVCSLLRVKDIKPIHKNIDEDGSATVVQVLLYQSIWQSRKFRLWLFRSLSPSELFANTLIKSNLNHLHLMKSALPFQKHLCCFCGWVRCIVFFALGQLKHILYIISFLTSVKKVPFLSRISQLSFAVCVNHCQWPLIDIMQW